jgi:hypothetical protein
LVSSVKWIEETYGKAALEDVARACSPEVRARLSSAIAIEWLPIREVVELATHADRLLGTGTGKLAESMGEAGARSSLRGPILRAVFYLGRPEFLIRKVTSIWRQYSDQGEMHVRSFEANRATFELTGTDEQYTIYCALLTGWFRELARATGIVAPSVRHTECLARGEARCFWEMRWAEIEEGG